MVIAATSIIRPALVLSALLQTAVVFAWPPVWHGGDCPDLGSPRLYGRDLTTRFSTRISPDKNWGARRWTDGIIGVWDVKSGHHKYWLNHGSVITEEPRFTRFLYTDDSKRLISYGSNGVIEFWELAGGTRQRYIYELMRISHRRKPVDFQDRDDINDALTFSRAVPMLSAALLDEAKEVVVGYPDGLLRLWDANTGEYRRDIRKGRARKVRISLTPDEQKLDTLSAFSKTNAAGDGLVGPQWVELWDIDQRELNDGRGVTSLFYSKKTGLIYFTEEVGSNETVKEMIVVYDPKVDRQILVLSEVNLIAQSTDEKALFVYDLTLRKVNLYDIKEGRLIREDLISEFPLSPKLIHCHGNEITALTDRHEVLVWKGMNRTPLYRIDAKPLVERYGVPSMITFASDPDQICLGFEERGFILDARAGKIRD